MRKIIAILVSLMMLFSVSAFGEEIDLGSMTSDELIALREAINSELIERNGIASTALHPGAYTVGKSIEVGSYILTYFENINAYPMPVGIGVYLDEERYRADDAFSYTIMQVGTSAFIELSEGMIIKIDNYEISIEKVYDISEMGDARSLPIADNNVQAGNDDGIDLPTAPETLSGITPKFKEIMDEYEAFFDYYIEFMNGLSSGDLDLSQIGEYTKMAMQYEETLEALGKMGEEEALTTADSHYYTEVSLRIMQKLTSAMPE